MSTQWREYNESQMASIERTWAERAPERLAFVMETIALHLKGEATAALTMDRLFGGELEESWMHEDGEYDHVAEAHILAAMPRDE